MCARCGFVIKPLHKELAQVIESIWIAIQDTMLDLSVANKRKRMPHGWMTESIKDISMHTRHVGLILKPHGGLDATGGVAPGSSRRYCLFDTSSDSRVT